MANNADIGPFGFADGGERLCRQDYIFLNLRCVLIYEPNDIRTEYDILNRRAITNQREIVKGS